MADPTLEEFKERFPALSSLDDEDLQANLDAAILELSEDAWGSRYAEGVLWLAAHMSALMPACVTNAQATGAVSSMKIGDESISFHQPGGGEDGIGPYLSQTKFGQRYYALRKLVFASRALSV